MTETTPPEPIPAPSLAMETAASEPAHSASAALRSRQRRHWLWVALLLMLGAAGWLSSREYRYREIERAAQAGQNRADLLEQRLSALEQQLLQAIDPLHRAQHALRSRLDDLAATHSVLREEVLAIGERAVLLEEAMKRLSSERLRGEQLMKAREAERVLRMGEERLRLFGDRQGALEAYAMADEVLAGMDDPMIASVRETLTRETQALRALPEDGAQRALEEIDRVLAALPLLPLASSARATPASESRLLALLSGLITVRRVGPEPRALDPLRREIELSALKLDLALARGAVERRDKTALDAALTRASRSIDTLFVADAPSVQQVRDRLATLRDLDLNPAPPALGMTRQELQRLHATRTEPPAAAGASE